MASEKNFENKIKKYLEGKGCWFLKYWGGAAYTKSGIPDLLVCCNGYFVGIEVKAPNGKPSELQLYNIRKISESGGIGIVLYPNQYEEFESLFENLISGNHSNAIKIATKINERW